MEFLWTSFEIVGTIAFAISGALVGVSRRMDIFGMLVLALATAIGGGIVRDILVGHFPPNSLQTGFYVLLTLAVTIAVFMVYRSKQDHHMSTRWVRRIYLTADTIGLASFTVTGTSVGVYAYPQYPIFCMILGILTAVGGGMIRDVLAQRVPSVLREEVYALPAIIGSAVYYVFGYDGAWLYASYGSFITVFFIRTAAIRYEWSLPRVY